MRPKSIVWFERIVWFAQLPFVAATALQWDDLQAEAEIGGFGAGFVILTTGGSIGLMLLLVWFIARRGSRVAKWIYVLLWILGVLTFVLSWQTDRLADDLLPRGTVDIAFALVQNLLYLLSLWLLFRPDAKQWFRTRGRTVDPDVFS